MLGKSSLVNLPTAPFKVGGAATAMLTDRVGTVANQVSVKLSLLAVDEEHSLRQQNKHIGNAAEGFLEAGRSIAHGVDGVFDIVRKPVEGARRGGLKGFAVGVGDGVRGAVFKPIAAGVGAVSDIGSGIAATAAAGAYGRRERNPRLRARQPRLLFDELQEVRPFTQLEAELQRQLGFELLRGVCEVIPLHWEHLRFGILLLFRRKVVWSRSVSKDDLTARPIEASRCQTLAFKDLRAARLDPEDRVLVLEGMNAATHALPINDAPLGAAALVALVEGFQGAVANPRKIASWRALRAALEHERANGIGNVVLADNSTGQRLLQVIEVQRLSIAVGSGGTRVWRPSRMLTDQDLTWRWVDPRGRRHPNIVPGLSREQCALRDKPPCELDQRFQPVTEWQPRVHEGTDPEGWVYSVAWCSSTWDTKPGLLDTIRKREWTKVYS